MHQQIKASPNNTPENVQRIVNALAVAGINIVAIAPDFDPPHVRVLVEHADFDNALAALADEGLMPQVKSAVIVQMKNESKALKKAMASLARRGFAVESVLTLPGLVGQNQDEVQVSFGISQSGIAGWDEGPASDLGGSVSGEIA